MSDTPTCDRCGCGGATRATWQTEAYEYTCVDCLTAAERVAFGVTP